MAPRIGVAEDKIAQYAGLHYYTDKELQVPNEASCRSACEVENEFLCRSYLFRGPPLGTAYNCQLFHLDHWTLPDGPSTYLNAERPLIDNGDRIGSYYENFCESKADFIYSNDSCTTNSLRYYFNINYDFTETQELPLVFHTTEDSTLSNITKSADVNCDKTGTCYDGMHLIVN